MEKTNSSSVSSSVISEYLSPTGWKQYAAPLYLSTNLLTRERKISVNTGKFIPGQYRVNPYEVLREDVTAGSCVVKIETSFYGTYYRFTYNGCLDGPLLMTSPEPVVPYSVALLKDEALLRAYSKLGKAEFGIGEDLGELSETIAMLRNPFKSLRTFLSREGKSGYLNLDTLTDLIVYGRKNKFRGFSGVKAAQAASDAWLELRYGFRPLIGSIENVVKAIQAVDDKKFDPKKIRSCRSNRTLKSREELLTSIPTWPGGGNGTVVTEHEWTVRASVQYTQCRPYSKLERLGLTAPFLPEIAWELTKLSFVVDWLFSIGPWIERFRATPEIAILGSTVGTKCVSISSTRNVSLISGYGDANKRTPVPPLSTKRRLWYKREVGLKPPKTPVFRCGAVLDLPKTIDLITLTLQRIRFK